MIDILISYIFIYFYTTFVNNSIKPLNSKIILRNLGIVILIMYIYN